MKRAQKLVLALSASVVLALGAVAPALAGPPTSAPNANASNACQADRHAKVPWC